ncbi:MAG: CHAT domain-containing protein [Thermodesulfobacteriota bacterium]
MRSHPITGLVLLGLLLSGCAYQMASERDRLEASGRYGDLEKHLQAQGVPAEKMNTQVLFPLCISYSKLKRYDKLFPCIEGLEANIHRGDRFDVAGPRGFEVKSDITPLPHLLRAEAYLELGDYVRAAEYARKANVPFPGANSLGYYSEFHVRKDALTILALAHAFNGDRVKAEEYCKELENLSLGGFAGIAVKSQAKGQALAKVYMSLGKYDKALGSLGSGGFGGLAALTDLVIGASAEQESIFTYLELPRMFMNYKCLMETGRLREAKTGYEKLLKTPQTRDNGEIYWLILFDRGRIAEKEGNPGEAVEFYRRAVEVIEQQRATIHTESSKIGFIGNKQEVYARIISVLAASNQVDLAFEYVERSKSRALVDLLAGKKDFVVKSGNAQQVGALLSMLDSAEAEGQTQGVPAESAKSRGIATRTVAALREQSPELSSLVSVTGVSTSDIRALLAADEALIEYYYDRESMFAFVLSAERIQAVRLDGANLAEDIRRYRAALQDPQSREHTGRSQDLYRRLVQPVIALTDKRKLTIVAHGAMHYLPFSCLHDGTQYLVERFGIRMLPSASVLKYIGPTGRREAIGVLTFGNPDLRDRRYDLAHAQQEAAEISRLIPGSRVLVRESATETAYRSHAREYRFIHFATHGRFDPKNPLQSALLLSQDKESDGSLTLGEVYAIRLDADLVTLSACETGLSGITGGDELVGLTRGFLYAGSNSIVASLWKVDDLATSHLMAGFYSELQRTDRREALRKAQMETMRRFPHPYYWAAFYLTGHPG